eukprot:6484939-Amphidinium_carterae.4
MVCKERKNKALAAREARCDVYVGHDTAEGSQITWQGRTARSLPEVKETTAVLNDSSETHALADSNNLAALC